MHINGWLENWHSHLSRLLLLGFYAVAWQGYKVRARVSPLGTAAILGAVVFSLLATGITGIHNTDVNAASINPWHLGLPQMDRWTINTMRYGLSLAVSTCFYLLRLALDRDTTYTFRSRRTLNTIALCVVVEVVLFVIAYAFIPRGNAFGYRHSFEYPSAALYRIIHDSYCVALNLAVVRYIWPFTRQERGGVKIGLRIFAVALVGSSLLACLRTTPLVIDLLGGPRMVVDNRTVLKPIAAVNHWMFILGLSWPLLADAVRVLLRPLRHRRLLAGIRPLWRECAASVPGAIVAGEDTLARRRTECFDVLAQLLAGKAGGGPAEHEASERLRDVVGRYDLDHPARTVADVVRGVSRNGAPATGDRESTTMLLDLAARLSARNETTVTATSSSRP